MEKVLIAETYPSAAFDFHVEVSELLGHEYILHGSFHNQPMNAKVAVRIEAKLMKQSH